MAWPGRAPALGSGRQSRGTSSQGGGQAGEARVGPAQAHLPLDLCPHPLRCPPKPRLGEPGKVADEQGFRSESDLAPVAAHSVLCDLGQVIFPLEKDCLRTCWCVRRRPRAAEGPSSHLGSLRGRMGLLTGLSVRGREGEVGVVRGWASGGGRCPRWPRPSVSEGAAEGGSGRDIARPLFQGEARAFPCPDVSEALATPLLASADPGKLSHFFISQFPVTWTPRHSVGDTAGPFLLPKSCVFHGFRSMVPELLIRPPAHCTDGETAAQRGPGASCAI